MFVLAVVLVMSVVVPRLAARKTQREAEREAVAQRRRFIATSDPDPFVADYRRRGAEFYQQKGTP